MEKLGLGAHAKKEARCPFPDHEDKHPSFSIWQVGGAWFWKCHSKCGSGDEISFIQKYKGLPRSAAMTLYLDIPVSLPLPLLSLMNILSLLRLVNLLSLLNFLSILCLLCPTDKR